MAEEKRYIESGQLLEDSYRLALAVVDSGFQPDLLLGVWRGGAPVAIAMQELMAYLGEGCDHGVVKTAHYTGLDERDTRVQVWGLSVYEEQINSSRALLLVDDVFDTGLSIEQLISDIATLCQDQSPEVRVATPWYKPSRNRTARVPDYYLHQTEDWLVFPHELCGLSTEELLLKKPANGPLIQVLKNRC